MMLLGVMVHGHQSWDDLTTNQGPRSDILLKTPPENSLNDKLHWTPRLIWNLKMLKMKKNISKDLWTVQFVGPYIPDQSERILDLMTSFEPLLNSLRPHFYKLTIGNNLWNIQNSKLKILFPAVSLYHQPILSSCFTESSDWFLGGVSDWSS